MLSFVSLNDKNCLTSQFCETESAKTQFMKFLNTSPLSNQKGFSLIELLMVVVIIGILAAVGVPSLSKSRDAAEKGAIIAVLRTLHNNQTTYLSQRGRYARLNELNAYFQSAFGTTSGTRINRRNYMFSMSPTNPSLTSLRTRYNVIAYRNSRGIFIPTFSIAENGVVESIVP